MPKRKLSKGIPCPGCQAKFDTETHVPFVGSCGHSICAVWVHQKEKKKTCPVCNEGKRFKLKKRNELAIELLAAKTKKKKAKKVKKPKFPKLTPKFEVGDDTYSSYEQVPAVLDPTNQAFLAQIVNQLDRKSFINLASSCKPLYNYCFNSNEIKVVYDLRMSVYRPDGVFCFKLDKKNGDRKYNGFTPMNYTDERGFLGSKTNRKKLRSYPFVFKLEKLEVLNKVDEDYIKALRSFLGEFPIDSITKLEVDHIEDWHGFLQLLKDLKIKNVYDEYNDYDYGVSRNRCMPKDVAAYILQNTDCFHTESRVSDSLILNSSVKELNLPLTKISQATFVDLLKRFSNSTEDVKWKLSCQDFEFSHFDLFNVLPFNYKGPLPEERPLVFTKDAKVRFCVLRQDGKILDCTSDYYIEFSTNNSYGFPPVFPAYYNKSDPQYSESDDDIDESDDFSDEESDGDAHMRYDFINNSPRDYGLPHYLAYDPDYYDSDIDNIYSLIPT